jgi:type IV pilus biogenesis/stability protein PilW
MKKAAVFSYLLLILFVFTACKSARVTEDQKKMAESHYKMGLSYFSENSITAALQELLKAYEYDPESYEINHLLGIAYLSKDKHEKAETHLKEAISLKNGDFPKAHNNLGVVYLKMQRYDDAIKQFEKAAGNILYDTPEFAYTNMGWAYYKKGDFIQAKKYYEESIKMEQRYSLAYYNLGLLYSDLEKYDDAVKEFKRAIKFSSNYLDAWYNMALAYFKTKETEKAIEAFSKVIEISPDSKQAENSNGYLELLK